MECGKAGELAVPAKLSNEEERTVTGDSDSIMCGENRSTDENSMSGRNGSEDLAVEETMETEFLQGVYVIQTAADGRFIKRMKEYLTYEDLNSIEIALAYQKLIDNYGLTQEGLSERVGKKRATIANYLRLLKLPAEIQVGLKDKKIDMGHARALIPVDDPEVQLALYEQILAQGLSVRNVEEMVRNIAEGIQPELPEKKKSDRKPILPEEFKLLKDHLSRYFNTKVQLTCNEKGKGKITIPFATEEELEQLIGLLDKLK